MGDLSQLFKLFNNKEKKDKEKKAKNVKTIKKATKTNNKNYYNKIRQKFFKKPTKIAKTVKTINTSNKNNKKHIKNKKNNSIIKKTNSIIKKTNSTTQTNNSTTQTNNSITQTNNSTTQINNTINSSKNNINGWDKYDVSGDGNCAFHAIALYYEKNKKKEELKNIGINSANGKKLREKITKNVKIHFTSYNQGYNNLNNNEKKNIKKIYTYNLINNNKSTILEHIKKSLEIFEKDCTYIDDHQLQIISAILSKKIFIWNAYQKYWHSIKFSDKFEITDTIFLYFKNSHYQLLLPNKDYKFKTLINIPKTSVFKYNFLEKVK